MSSRKYAEDFLNFVNASPTRKTLENAIAGMTCPLTLRSFPCCAIGQAITRESRLRAIKSKYCILYLATNLIFLTSGATIMAFDRQTWPKVFPHPKCLINCCICGRTKMAAGLPNCHDWRTYGFALSSHQANLQAAERWLPPSWRGDLWRRALAYLVRP